MIELDGSLGEGGGQILRTALALSLITGKAFRIDNIRAKRPKPGLMRQHLACVQAAVAVGGGVDATHAVSGRGQAAQVGDTSLTFTPGNICAGDYEFAIGSAGSCMLVLQTVLWPLVMVDRASALTLRGGTHNPMAPSLSFLQLLTPYLSGLGPDLYAMELRGYGFYPAGGGEVRVAVRPPAVSGARGLAPIDIMQRGALVESYAECLHGGVPKGVAERELAVLKTGLDWKDEQLRNRALRADEGPGNVLLVVLKYEHITEVFASYGERGVSAEHVAHKLLHEVRAYQAHAAPVGPHLADQLMMPMALAALQAGNVQGGGQGGGQYWATELTEHTRTNALVIEKFLPIKFAMQDLQGGVVISVEA